MAWMGIRPLAMSCPPERLAAEANGAAQVEWMEPDVLEARRNFMETDPPRHTAWRRQFARSFTPRAVDAIRTTSAAMAAESYSSIRDRGEGDLVAAFSTLPLRVICRLIGVPDAVVGQHVGLQQPPCQHRQRREQHESDQSDHEEGDHGMAGHSLAGTRGDPSRAGRQDR